MRVKQQKQIKAFCIEEFGEERGLAMFDRQEKTFRALVEKEKNPSRNQRMVLVQIILPCIALYQILSEECASKEAAYAHMRKYMLEKVGAKSHASTAKMEFVPGFYAIYSAVFLRVTRTAGLWESTQTRGRNCFDVTIRKCLWHTACMEHGCGELCRLFCESDNVTYHGLKKIGFARTKTLGCGGACCDFHFFKK